VSVVRPEIVRWKSEKESGKKQEVEGVLQMAERVRRDRETAFGSKVLELGRMDQRTGETYEESLETDMPQSSSIVTDDIRDVDVQLMW
jgi:hypothetical protein